MARQVELGLILKGEEAEEFLGDISRRTLYRLVDAMSIRKGRHKGKVVLCRRSVTDYAKSLEI